MSRLKLTFTGMVNTRVKAGFGALATLGSLIALIGTCLAIHAFARSPRPAPMTVTHTLSLPEFGLKLTLPSAWKLEVGQTGNDFMATHSDTGAILGAAVEHSDPPASDLDATLNRIVEKERARSGVAKNISRGPMVVGVLAARWLKFSVSRQGERMPMRTVAVQRGLSTLTLSCTGGAPAQKACDAAVHQVGMPH